jgi:hypothetical protein
MLASNDLFEARTLKLGKCPNCGVPVVELSEIRKADAKEFFNKYSGNKAHKVVEKEHTNIIRFFNLKNAKKVKSILFKGLCYCDNRDVKIGKTNKRRVYRVGLWGDRELIKEIKING